MNRNQVRVLGAVLLVIATVAAVIFAIVPAVSALQNPSELVALQRSNDTLTAQLNGLNQNQKQYEATRAVAVNLEKQFPAAANVPQVTALIAAAASQAGFSSNDVTNLTFANPVAATAAQPAQGAAQPAPSASAGATAGSGTASASNYATQSIQITLQGGNEARYARFLSALTRYSTTNRVLAVTNFNVAGGTTGGKNLTVTVTTYLHPAIALPQFTGAGASSAPSTAPTSATN